MLSFPRVTGCFQTWWMVGEGNGVLMGMSVSYPGSYVRFFWVQVTRLKSAEKKNAGVFLNHNFFSIFFDHRRHVILIYDRSAAVD